MLRRRLDEMTGSTIIVFARSKWTRLSGRTVEYVAIKPDQIFPIDMKLYGISVWKIVEFVNLVLVLLQDRHIACLEQPRLGSLDDGPLIRVFTSDTIAGLLNRIIDYPD